MFANNWLGRNVPGNRYLEMIHMEFGGISQHTNQMQSSDHNEYKLHIKNSSTHLLLHSVTITQSTLDNYSYNRTIRPFACQFYTMPTLRPLCAASGNASKTNTVHTCFTACIASPLETPCSNNLSKFGGG